MLALRIRSDHARHAGMSAGRLASQRASSSRRHAGPTWAHSCSQMSMLRAAVARRTTHQSPASTAPPATTTATQARSPAHCASSGDTGAGTRPRTGRPTRAPRRPRRGHPRLDDTGAHRAVRVAPGRRHGHPAAGRVRDRDRRHVLHQHRGRRRAFRRFDARAFHRGRVHRHARDHPDRHHEQGGREQRPGHGVLDAVGHPAGRPAVVGFMGSPPDRPRQPRPVRGRAADGGGPDGTGRRSRYCADR